MRRELIAALSAFALAVPPAALAAAGEAQKQTMQEHMKTMHGMMMAQMQKAQGATGMSPEQARACMDEHMKLMQEMMSQPQTMQEGMRGMEGMHGKK